MPAWSASSLYGRLPLALKEPKWCLARRRGIRTTVKSRLGIFGIETAGADPGLGVWGVEASRGSLWPGPGRLESG